MGIKSKAVKKLAKKLDMSHAARMERARDMGFDTDKVWYHGTPDNRGLREEGFKTQNERFGLTDDDPRKAFFFSKDKDVANTYADDRRAFDYQNADPEVLGTYINPGNQAEINWHGRPFRGREPMGRDDLQRIADDMERTVEAAKADWEAGGSLDTYKQARRARDEFLSQNDPQMFKEYALADELDRLREEGYDSVVVKNIIDNYNADGRPTDLAVKFDNKGIRDVNAAFDPDKKDSANLLASLGGATVLGGAAMAPENAEAGVVTKGGKKIIEAFHGSPHKFDKFSTANIGTGEGAQAYGHGLYFADSEDVARGYKRSTNYADKKRQFQGELPDDADIEEVMSMREDGVFSDEMNTLLDALEQDDFLGYDSPAQAITAAFSKDIQNYDPSPELLKAIDSGSLYKVDIDATPDELLDWDLPLSEQSEAVKQAYAGYLASADSKDVARQWSRYQEGMGLDEAEPLLSITGDPSGNNLYRNAFKDREAANQYLTSAGIKGIKYKDGFSRGADGVEGTSNYVIFDENIISIAKKYGVSLPVAGMIAAGATPQEAQASYNSVGDFVQRRAAKKGGATLLGSAAMARPATKGDIESPVHPMVGKMADYASRYNNYIDKKPLLGFIAPEAPEDLLRKMAYDDDRGYFDYLMASLGMM